MTRWARRLAWVVVLALWVPAGAGQDDAPTTGAEGETQPAQAVVADPGLAEPGTTIETFIEAMREFSRTGSEDAFSRARACCVLDAVPSAGTRRELVAGLFNVIRRVGVLAETRDPSAEPGYALGAWRYFPPPLEVRVPEVKREVADEFPGTRIELIRDERGTWRFSADTMERVPSVWRAMDKDNRRAVLPGRDLYVTPGQKIRAMVPEWLRTGTFAGVEYWQWIAILIVILAGVALDHAFRWFLAAAWRRQRAKHDQASDREVVKKAVRPFGLLAAAIFWLAMLNLGGLPVLVTGILIVAAKVVIGFAGVWAAFRVTDLLAHVARQRASRTRTKIDDLLIPLVERTLKVFFCAMGVIYIADSFSVEILPLLTGLGIGGLAVAFAAKDTIENFFGSVAVILDRPFEVGDWVVIGDVEGSVETMGLRSTRIRTFYNSLITMPNAELVCATVDNMGKRRYRRFKTMINITYDTTPTKIDAFCEGIRELIRLHPMTRKDYYHVYLNQFGAHSLDILLYVFHECPDWPAEMRERHRLMLDIIRLADRLGVSFAFPTQTLHVFNEEKGVPHVPSPPPGSDAELGAHELALAEVKRITTEQRWMGERPGPVEFGGAKTKG